MNRVMLLTAAGICLLISGCGKLNWQEFSSEDGKYTVLMPGKPKRETRSQLGLTVNMDVVEVSKGAFGVSYTELPPGTPVNYDGAVQGMANANKGKVLSQSNITLDGVKGVEAEMEVTSPRKGYAVARIFVVNNRLYQVLVMGSNTRASDADVKKFLDSFKINK